MRIYNTRALTRNQRFMNAVIAGSIATILSGIALGFVLRIVPIAFDIFYLIYLIGTVGFSVNSFLATFNLLPVYSLDGTKVMKWNIGIWIVVFVIAGAMMLTSITIGAENMVVMIIESV